MLTFAQSGKISPTLVTLPADHRNERLSTEWDERRKILNETICFHGLDPDGELDEMVAVHGGKVDVLVGVMRIVAQVITELADGHRHGAVVHRARDGAVFALVVVPVFGTNSVKRFCHG